ncbi:MFS general substrate transporter [Aspergillus minisclerotigenes]|uniref:MFS general substrate transporter n=1 Tax=Aspergillus minisclerotigenes TaxID=656917 RepID=A0A5N6JJR8_9EURO|nr:MFS general substrate transporter [Aspergillus minisclerotigenes]
MSDNTSNQQDGRLTPSMAPAAWKPDFPDGGLRAWSVAAGAAGLMLCAFGYVNSFGVYQGYYLANQLSTRPPNGSSWIGPLQVFFPFSDRSLKLVLWPSALLFIFCVMMTSIYKVYYQFLLAQGILEGITSGMIMPPGLAAVGHYFLDNRGAVLGIAVRGSSLGGVIFPVTLTKMLNNSDLEFSWSVRICAFLVLGILLYVRLCGHVYHHAKNPLFLSTVLPNSFLVMGLFIPMFYLPTYTERAHGMSPQLSLYLVVMLNGGLFFGRIILRMAADRLLGRLNVLDISGLATGIMWFCWTRAHSIPKDPRDIGRYIGIGMFCAAFGAVIGTPISGVLVSQSGGFETVSIFSGVMTTVGSCMVLLVELLSGQGLWSRY